jgi:hypothetical protein
MKGVIGGLLSMLRDFEFQAGAGTPLCVTGNSGLIVGAPGTREKLAEALSAAVPAVLGCVCMCAALCGCVWRMCV